MTDKERLKTEMVLMVLENDLCVPSKRATNAGVEAKSSGTIGENATGNSGKHSTSALSEWHLCAAVAELKSLSAAALPVFSSGPACGAKRIEKSSVEGGGRGVSWGENGRGEEARRIV